MVRVVAGAVAVWAKVEVLGTLRVASVGPGEQRPTGSRRNWVEVLVLGCCLLLWIVCKVEVMDRVKRAHL